MMEEVIDIFDVGNYYLYKYHTELPTSTQNDIHILDKKTCEEKTTIKLPNYTRSTDYSMVGKYCIGKGYIIQLFRHLNTVVLESAECAVVTDTNYRTLLYDMEYVSDDVVVVYYRLKYHSPCYIAFANLKFDKTEKHSRVSKLNIHITKEALPIKFNIKHILYNSAKNQLALFSVENDVGHTFIVKLQILDMVTGSLISNKSFVDILLKSKPSLFKDMIIMPYIGTKNNKSGIDYKFTSFAIIDWDSLNTRESALKLNSQIYPRLQDHHCLDYDYATSMVIKHDVLQFKPILQKSVKESIEDKYKMLTPVGIGIFIGLLCGIIIYRSRK